MTENIVELLPSLLARARALTSNNEDAEDLVERCLCWAIDHSDEFQPSLGALEWLIAILVVLAAEKTLLVPFRRKRMSCPKKH